MSCSYSCSFLVRFVSILRFAIWIYDVKSDSKINVVVPTSVTVYPLPLGSVATIVLHEFFVHLSFNRSAFRTFVTYRISV